MHRFMASMFFVCRGSVPEEAFANNGAGFFVVVLVQCLYYHQLFFRVMRLSRDYNVKYCQSFSRV